MISERLCLAADGAIVVVTLAQLIDFLGHLVFLFFGQDITFMLAVELRFNLKHADATKMIWTPEVLRQKFFVESITHL